MGKEIAAGKGRPQLIFNLGFLLLSTFSLSYLLWQPSSPIVVQYEQEFFICMALDFGKVDL